MTFLKRNIRPVHVVLLTCLILFLLKTQELASLEREVAPALAALNLSKPGAFHNQTGIKAFLHEYMADPFGKAIGLSERQLQLCRQVSTMIPAYQSAVSWRGNALFVGLSTLLALAFHRYYSTAAGSQRFAELRNRVQLLIRRAAIAAAPMISKMQQRIGQKPAGATYSAVNNIIACPGCSQKLRVPAGKGRILATCSACGAKFECLT